MTQDRQPERRRNAERRRGWMGRRSADRQRAQRILDTSHDAFVSVDGRGVITAWNEQAEATFGWRREEVLGRDAKTTLVPERYRDAIEARLRDVMDASPEGVHTRRFEARVLHRLGHELPVEVTASALRDGDDGRWSFHAFVEDVGPRKLRERNRAAILAATRVLAGSETLDQAAPQLLAEAGSGFGCSFGALWLADDEGRALRARAVWAAPDLASSSFAQATRRATLAAGECLPGRIWQTGRPEWLEDVGSDHRCTRGSTAVESGLHSAKGVPVRVRGETIGALEFFAQERHAVDEELLDMLTIVGSQLGEFIARARSVADLAVERELLSAVLESLAEPVVACDEHGRLILFNRAARELHGKGEEPVDPDAWPTHYNLFRPGGKEPLPLEEIPLYRVLQREQVDGAELVIAPPGREPRIMSARGRPLTAPDGSRRGAVVAMHDVTDERRADELRARLASVVESSVDAILSTDDRSRIRSWNPGAEALFGYTAAEAIGQPVMMLFPPERAAEGAAASEAVCSGRAIQQYETQRLHKDGRSVDVAVTVSPIRSEDGGIAGASAIIRDISARLKAEAEARRAEEAERANRAQREFLSRMSHELRTPLNAILGFGQLLEAQNLDDRQRADVARILKAGRDLLQLVDDALQIARLEGRSEEGQHGPVDVPSLISEVLALVTPLAAEARVELRVDAMPADGTSVMAEPTVLKQALVNVISNAIKYTPEGDTATVRLDGGHPGRLRISVTAGGSAIEPADLSKLFVPFEHVKANVGDPARGRGTGLGLALAQRLVESMDGTVSVEPEQGGGNTFSVDLPVASGEAAKSPAGSGLGTPNDPRGEVGNVKRAVLYIEDHPANLKLVEQALARRPDIRLVPATNGGLGLDLARQQDFDLILLDLHLPDMEGDAVLHALDPETAGTPVVVLSADATQRQIDRAAAAGARAYLTKPLDLRQLLEVVDELVPRATGEGGAA